MNRKSFFVGILVGLIIMGMVSFVVFAWMNRDDGGNTSISDSIEKLINSFQRSNVDEEQKEYKEQDGITEVVTEEEHQIDASEFEDKLSEIDEILDAAYYEEYNQNDLWESAYEGYVAGIGDPYTNYFTAEQYASFIEDTSGTYEGIGVVVSFSETGDNVQVVGPFEGSPGEKAGILPEDIILRVNDIDIEGFTLEEVVKEIKGPKGTDVVLNIYRASTGEIMDFTITRDVISQETVKHEMLEDSIGYIKVSGFQEVTYDQFMVAMEDLEKQGMKGLIIDLRNNPGGLVNIVSEMVDEILPEGLIVYTEDKNGNRNELKSDEEHQFSKPLVVLVNQHSASASEIFAGAIKDYGVGTIVGTTTFGKGLVQTMVEMEDGSAIKVTIARYFTPKGNYINKIGIEPNVLVELPEDLQNKYNIEREEDTQFLKAIEVIADQIQ